MSHCSTSRSGRIAVAPRARPEGRVSPQRPRVRRRTAPAVALLLALLASACVLPGTFVVRPAFRIRVVDADTGRGIPAAELRTTDSRSFFTDSAGVIAFLEPDLLGKDVFFEIRSFGYRYEPSVFGFRGLTLSTGRGRSAVVKIKRENIAERLYRVTGTGIYRDSELLGDFAPVHDPVDGVPPTGMDSVLTAIYGGELFWIWGDTRVSSNPLGNFRSTGARSKLPDRGGLDPNVGVRLRYLRKGRDLRPMVEDVEGIVWLTALRTALDAGQRERLFATYAKITASLRAGEEGLVEFDDAAGAFRVVTPYPPDAPAVPRGQVFHHTEDGRGYFYYDMFTRSPDDAESVRQLAAYETFTPLRSGGRWDGEASAFERDGQGHLVWSWKSDAAAITPEQWDTLVEKKVVTPRERPYQLIDVETGETIKPHNGSVRWNPYRKRWVMIRSRIGSPVSFLGEVYYFEADTPVGPWAYGQRIVSHTMSAFAEFTNTAPPATYTFYNPVHHAELDRDGGREIFFEGTMATTFAVSPAPALPGYEYNQMMYRLDLGDRRLAVPVAIYRTEDDGALYRTRAEATALPARGKPTVRKWDLAFFAPDRRRPKTIPVREVVSPGEGRRLVTGKGEGRAVFYCAPDGEGVPPGSVPLYERRDARGRWTYGLDSDPSAAVLCRVWSAPVDYMAELSSLQIASEPDLPAVPPKP